MFKCDYFVSVRLINNGSFPHRSADATLLKRRVREKQSAIEQLSLSFLEIVSQDCIETTQQLEHQAGQNSCSLY